MGILEYIALWDYVGAGSDDLTFSQDDVVLVGDENDEDWWFGTLEKSKQSGYFPRAYVESKPDGNVHVFIYSKTKGINNLIKHL
jgi:hypothetical protein